MFESRLDQIPPGPELAVALATCDVCDLNGREALRFVRATQRLQAWTESLQLEGVAVFTDRRAPASEPDLTGHKSVPGAERSIRPGGEGTPEVLEFASEELSAELGMSAYRAGQEVADALDLRHRLPLVAGALRAGRVDGWRARLVARGTRSLSSSACARVETQILGRLDRVTSRQVERLARAAAIAEDPESIEGKPDPGTRKRQVQLNPTDSVGNRELWAVVTAVDGVRLDARIHFVANLLREEAKLTGVVMTGDADEVRSRSLGLLADPEIVLALHRRVVALRGGESAESGAHLPQTVVYIHVRRDELLGDGSAAATLEGDRRQPSEPISMAAVREALGHSDITLKPVIDLDHMAPGGGYAFTGDLREAVLMKSPTCIFPFCDRPARITQVDHTVEYPRGPTSVDNGGPSCERHHRVKTHGRWRLEQPFNGIYVWYSPTGHVYVVDDRATLRVGAVA